MAASIQTKNPGREAAAVALHTMFYNFVRIHQTLKMSPAMAAGVTDRLWEMSDLVQVLEDWEAQQESEPSFDIDTHAVDKRPFVRVTFPDGKTEAIYGFASRADAIKWIRCDAVVWLYERRKKLEMKEASN